MRRLIRTEFQIKGNTYFLDIETGIFKVKQIHLGEELYSEKQSTDGVKLVSNIPVKWTASTLLESLTYWLSDLKIYLAKKSRKKSGKPRSSNSRNSARRDI